MDAEERIAKLEARVDKLREALRSMSKDATAAVSKGITADELIHSLVKTHKDPAAVLSAYRKISGEVDAAITYDVKIDAHVTESLERQQKVIRWLEQEVIERQSAVESSQDAANQKPPASQNPPQD